MLQGEDRKKANEIVEELKLFFNNRSSNYQVSNLMEKPWVAFDITFIAYSYYVIRFNYENGRFGMGIFSEQLIPVCASYSTMKKENKDYSFQDYLREFDFQLRLRIPDKFLLNHGW